MNTKAQRERFIETSVELFKTELGAQLNSTFLGRYEYVIETRIGPLFLHFAPCESMYTVFGYFVKYRLAREVFGHWKFNQHLISETPELAAQSMLDYYKNTINEKTALL